MFRVLDAAPYKLGGQGWDHRNGSTRPQSLLILQPRKGDGKQKLVNSEDGQLYIVSESYNIPTFNNKHSNAYV